MVIAAVMRTPRYLGIRGTITGLYVPKEYRGSRRGYDLLLAAEDWLRQKRIQTMQIFEPIHSGLAHFHEKHGFDVVATILMKQMEYDDG